MRGEFYLDLEFSEHWYDELREMNKGKRGAQFKFPDSFIKWMAVWHQLVDYRGLEGIGRILAKYNLIPYFGDYTTLWNRIHKISIKIIPENKEFVESDGTGLKTSNAGEYRQFKYENPNAKRKKYLVVIITADVKKKKLLYLEHIQGEGQSEPKVAEKQIKEDSKKYKIKKFYGDSAYDTNNMFDILQSVGVKAAIIIRKNAAPENVRGSKRRRKEARIYKRLGYRKWAVYKKYGMRWVGTEGIFSAVKRKYGENTVSRS
ncbi:MAG: transposase, partial [Candidatus Micrarchaeaceae archaeon]